MSDLERKLLQTIHDKGCVDTYDFASAHGIDHQVVIGLMKSLEAAEIVCSEERVHFRWVLTAEAREYLSAGSPEAQFFRAVPAGGISLADLKAQVPPAVSDIGLKQAMKLKWVTLVQRHVGTYVVRQAKAVEDKVQALLAAVDRGEVVDKADAEALAKRKLLTPIAH